MPSLEHAYAAQEVAVQHYSYVMYTACNYASYQYTAAYNMLCVSRLARKFVVYQWTTNNGKDMKASLGATCKSACIQSTAMPAFIECAVRLTNSVHTG